MTLAICSWLPDFIAEMTEEGVAAWPMDTYWPVLERFGIEHAKAIERWPDIALALRLNRPTADKAKTDIPPSRISARLHDVGALALRLKTALADLEQFGEAAIQAGQDEKALALWRIEREAVAGTFSQTGYDYWSQTVEEREECLAALARFRLDLGTMSLNLNAAAVLLTNHPPVARTGSLPGLKRLVPALADAWVAMTGRPATAERVERKAGTDEPDFVRFIVWAAQLVGMPPPTRSQVGSALPPKSL